MPDAILFANEDLLIHGLRAEDPGRFHELATDIFAIRANSQTLKYLESKRLYSLAEAEVFLRGMIMNISAARSFHYFITDKHSGRVIGMIAVICPELVREHFHLPDYPHFIGFI